MALSDASIERAIDVLQDRLKKLLPVYVPMKPAQNTSIVIVSVILLLIIPIIYRRYAYAKTIVEQAAAAGMAVTTLVVAVVVMDMLRLYLYRVSMYAQNSQHFANVMWLDEYAKAARGSGKGIF